MIQSEAQAIIEIWGSFKRYVPAHKQVDMAIKLLKIFDDLLVPIEDLGIEGEDDNLDAAILGFKEEECNTLSGYVDEEELDEWN